MATGIPRLKRRAEFLRVAGSGRRWAAPGLVLQAARRESAPGASANVGDGPRVGFTASRKVGIAVARNRARRRLRAVVAAIMERHAAADHDYVVVARGGTLTRDYQALAADLETALRRLDLWR